MKKSLFKLIFSEYLKSYLFYNLTVASLNIFKIQSESDPPFSHRLGGYETHRNKLKTQRILETQQHMEEVPLPPTPTLPSLSFNH